MACDDGALRCFNVRNGERICELTGHEDAVQAALFDVRGDVSGGSSGGPEPSQFLVSCGSDATFRLWT